MVGELVIARVARWCEQKGLDDPRRVGVRVGGG